MKGEQNFTFTRECRFVPWDCVATMEDGRRIKGPCFLMGPAAVGETVAKEEHDAR